MTHALNTVLQAQRQGGTTLGFAPSGSWVARENAPEEGGHGAALVGTGSHVYAFRGGGTIDYDRKEFWRYNLSSNNWDTMENAPQNVKNGAMLVWDNGNYIYAVFGGAYGDIDGSGRHYFYRYNISGDNWEVLAPTSAINSRGQCAGDALAWVLGSVLGVGDDNFIYATIGSKSHTPVGFGRYSIKNDTWEDMTSTFPWNATDDGASLVWTGGDYLYLLRGEYIESVATYDFARFNLQDNTWDTTITTPESLWSPEGTGDGASLEWVGGSYIYALSGGAYNEVMRKLFSRYSISGDTWENLENIPEVIGYFNGDRLAYAGANVGSTGGSLYCYRVNDSTAFWMYELEVVAEWTQTNWSGGATDPDLEVGTWDSTYNKYYQGENADTADGENIKLVFEYAENIATHIVISEVYPDAVDEYNGEWVELYNPTSNDLNIQGWDIVDEAGTIEATLPTGSSIPAYGHFLIADGGWSTNASDNPNGILADVEDEMALVNDDDAIILRDANDVIVDTFGYGEGTTEYENTPGPDPAQQQSCERKAQASSTEASMAPGGADENLGNAYDTENNANDFVLHTAFANVVPENSSDIESPPGPVGYKPSGWLESSIYDADQVVIWGTITFDNYTPTGTSLTVKVKGGSDNNPYDGPENWSVWQAFDNGADLPYENRYLQYRVDLSTTDNTITPKFSAITLPYSTEEAPPGKPVLVSPENATQTDNTPTFEWIVGSDADNHRLLVDDNSSFSSPADNVLLGGADNQWTKPAPGYPDDNYYWKVIAINPQGENESDTWTFEVVAAAPPVQENLYEASTQVVTGTEVSGTSTDNLDADDGAYYEVDATGGGGGTEDAEPASFGGAGDEYEDTRVSGSLSDMFTDDGTYCEYDKGDHLSIETWDTTGLSGAVTDVVLWVNYDVESGYDGTNSFEWKLDDNPNWNSTTVTPADGQTDYTDSYVILSGGSWTISDLASLDLHFYNNDGKGPDWVRVDWCILRATTSGGYALEIRHDSEPITGSQGDVDSIQITLNFKSSATATYYLDIYNFSTPGWESLQSGSVGTTEVTWENTITTSPADYISANDNIRVRLYTSDEASAHRSQEDYLVYVVSYTAAEQVLVNPSFELPGSAGSPPDNWSTTPLDNAPDLGTSVMEQNNDPDSGTIPDGSWMARTYFKHAVADTVGVAFEQASSTFGTVDSSTTNTISYQVEFDYGSYYTTTYVNWAGAIVEVEFTSGASTYKLRYYHPVRTDYVDPPDYDNVRYIILDNIYDTMDNWNNFSNNINDDIQSEFGITTFTVDAIRFGVVADKINTNTTLIDVSWDQVQLTSS